MNKISFMGGTPWTAAKVIAAATIAESTSSLTKTAIAETTTTITSCQTMRKKLIHAAANKKKSLNQIYLGILHDRLHDHHLPSKTMRKSLLIFL